MVIFNSYVSLPEGIYIYIYCVHIYILYIYILSYTYYVDIVLYCHYYYSRRYVYCNPGPSIFTKHVASMGYFACSIANVLYTS